MHRECSVHTFINFMLPQHGKKKVKVCCPKELREEVFQPKSACTFGVHNSTQGFSAPWRLYTCTCHEWGYTSCKAYQTPAPTQWSLVTADTSVAFTATDIPSFTLYTVKCIKPPYAAEVTFSLTIQSDLAWKLILGSLPIQMSQLKIATPPRLLNVSAVLSLLTTLDSLKLCIGNPEEQYLNVIEKKGPLTDKTGT